MIKFVEMTIELGIVIIIVIILSKFFGWLSKPSIATEEDEDLHVTKEETSTK